MKEYNVVVKDKPGLIRVALLYPSQYRVALSSLSYQTLYYMVNMDERFAAERIVEDWAPVSIETGLPLSRFQVVMVSLHYELDYAAMVRMLHEAGIPLWRWKRGEEDPIVVVGGPPATSNPAPILDLVDAVVVGEAEPVMPGLLDTLAAGSSRKAMLEALAGVPGVYVPGVSQKPVKRQYVVSLDEAFHPVAQIQSEEVEPIWGRSLLVESGRGCARGCRFCMEGHVTLPRRERSFGVLERIIREGLKINRVGKVAFYDLAFADHSSSRELLELVVEELGAEVSVPSLRADALSEEHISLIARGGQRTLTVAPETPYPHLCQAINKVIGDDVLVKVARAASEAGMKILKLYYIVGMPCEPPDAAERIAEQVSLVAEAAKGLRLRVSANPFMPKPHTPLQWAPLPGLADVRHRLRMLVRLLARRGVEVEYYDPRLAQVQTALSRGGPELGKVIVSWALGGGGLGAWRRALRMHGVGVERYVEALPLEGELPWERVVDTGVPREALRRGYEIYMASACQP